MLAGKYLRKHKKLIFIALILAVINQVFSLLDPQIFRLIIDNYASKYTEFTQDEFIRGVLLLLLASVGVALVSRIAKTFQDYYVNAVSQRVGTELYSDSVKHSLALPYATFEDQQSGQLLQKMQKAKLDTQTLMLSFVNVMFLSAIGLIFVIIYAFTVHWQIGLTYLLMVPIVGFFTFKISKKIKSAQKDIVKETSDLAGSTTETIRNVELVKSLGLESQEVARLNETNNKILGLELKKVKIMRKMSFIQGTLVNSMRALILIIMLWLIFQGKVTIGEFFTLFVYSFFIFGPLSEFGTVVSSYQEAKASNEKLEEVLKEKPVEIKPGSKEINKIKSIELNRVTFKYSSRDEGSLSDVNLKIKGGEVVAFCGPSGSGKTTPIKLILGLYNLQSGSIKINGINSDEINYDSLRKKIGFVSQETQLFAGTVRENLLFVNPQATDTQCLEVLKSASALDIINRGGKGLDTKIGEGGIKLSGGERQRLAIARALLRNPELIIFDEATSSLDSITEREITQTIEVIKKKNPSLTMIVIAHRLSTVLNSDRIFVLEKGKILESGSHKNLLKKKGLYNALWREQQGEGSRKLNA